ncbi:MAG: ubiquitin-like domain-containing protein [Anaerolineae bacterium]|nr:ubiquitin-like domain-containing protein [Anaerolineae bacterium]
MRRLGVGWLAALILVSCSSSSGRSEFNAQVYLSVDGEVQAFMTASTSISELLLQAEVELQPGDRVLESGVPYLPQDDLPEREVYFLTVRRAAAFELLEDGGSRVISSSAATLAEALMDAGLTLFAADRLQPAAHAPLSPNLQASLVRSRPVEITLDGVTYHTRSAAQSVGEVLAESGLSPQGMDYSLPPENASLPADGRIHLVRVTEDVIIQQEPLAFETLFQPAAEVDIDTIQTVQHGEYGLTSKRIRIRYEDGVEISRQVEDEWVARQPTPRIQGYGTKITVRTLATPDGTIEYWRALEVWATSYAPFNAGTPVDAPNYGITYSGEPLRKGHIAVLRSWYPSMAGRSYYVPGYGFGTVADIGGGVAGRHWIDLGYTDEEWVSWHSWVTFYFLTPVPPADQILWVLP